MGDAAQTGLYAAQNNGHRCFEVAADKVGVDIDRTIGAFGVFSAGGVVVGVSKLLGRGVVGDHGVDAPPAHSPVDTGLTETFDVHIAVDVRLADNADFEAELFENTPDHRHADIGRVDVSIAADKDNIKLFPAALVHLFAGGGEVGVCTVFHKRNSIQRAL